MLAALPLLGPRAILGCCPIVPGLIGSKVLPAGTGWSLSSFPLPRIALTARVAQPHWHPRLAQGWQCWGWADPATSGVMQEMPQPWRQNAGALGLLVVGLPSSPRGQQDVDSWCLLCKRLISEGNA